jgi:hypothetical protein
MKECLVYAAVQITPTTTPGSTRHGTATFASGLLPTADDEFYQFCYVAKTSKSLGSSLPFQLNCSIDDIDLLTNGSVKKIQGDGLIALADYDQDDIIVIHTKSMLTEKKLRDENRQLLEIKRRLEIEKVECQAKLEVIEMQTQEHLAKTDEKIKVSSSNKILSMSI